jgi:hypothetical protein
MVKITRGILVVALLLFVNIQLFILVLRSGELTASEHQTSQFTLAAVTRDTTPSLRGDGSPSSNTISFLRSSEQYVEESVTNFLKGSWIGSGSTNEGLGDDAATSPSFTAKENDLMNMLNLPEVVRPLRPKGKWLRQVLFTYICND